MTVKKTPIAAMPAGAGEVLFLKALSQDEFSGQLASSIGLKNVRLLDSGISAFYVILEALKEMNKKREVILPAYTAGSLIVAIRKAGLRPVLSEITMEDFNMDMAAAGRLVGKDTLAVLGIHMFGIVNTALHDFKKRFPDVFMIEDCAQALGSLIDGKSVGHAGDASFFSFNKGKNMPTLKGGCIASGDGAIAERVDRTMKGVKEDTAHSAILMRFKMAALAMLADPYIYGIFYGAIDGWREKKPPRDFNVEAYSGLQAALGSRLLSRLGEMSGRRYENGMRLINGLGGVDGVITPKIAPNTRPAFNRLPVVFKDAASRDRVSKELWLQGIETGTLYPEPLHHMFDLGYDKDSFPNATYVASHTLTFPVHPLVQAGEIDRMVETIKKVIAHRV